MPARARKHETMAYMAEENLGTDTPNTVSVPDKPALEGLEERLSSRWRTEGTYHFNEDTSREAVYSIDTPPPTASGSLHVGHMFSYTQTDVVARYQRMSGKNVFYRWVGTTTACPPSAASRTTTGCAATRPSPTSRTTSRRPSRRRTSATGTWSAARTSSSCASSWPWRTRRSSNSCSPPWACPWTGG